MVKASSYDVVINIKYTFAIIVHNSRLTSPSKAFVPFFPDNPELGSLK